MFQLATNVFYPMHSFLSLKHHDGRRYDIVNFYSPWHIIRCLLPFHPVISLYISHTPSATTHWTSSITRVSNSVPIPRKPNITYARKTHQNRPDMLPEVLLPCDEAVHFFRGLRTQDWCWSLDWRFLLVSLRLYSLRILIVVHRMLYYPLTHHKRS